MAPSDARRTAAGTTLLDSLASVLPSVRPAHVDLRNYDDDRAYEFTLEVRDGETVVFEREYRLDPGESRTERGVLAPGSYEVVVHPATGDPDAATCRVDDDPARTVRVEAGNAVVTVSDAVS